MKETMGFDWDGVGSNSRRHAHNVANGIMALLGAEELLVGQGDFDRLFGAEALVRLVDHRRAEALGGTHRLAMVRAARDVLLVNETLAVIGRHPPPCIVNTAAYAEGGHEAEEKRGVGAQNRVRRDAQARAAAHSRAARPPPARRRPGALAHRLVPLRNP
jgi:hypothetical protein